MLSLKTIAAILLPALCTNIVAAQARTIEVVGRDGQERNHIAHQLGLEPHDIGPLRNLLERATELALESELDPTWSSVGSLAPLWRQIHPSQAIPTVEKLVNKLKATARETPDFGTYAWCGTTALFVVQTLYRENPPLETLFQDWPERPDLAAPSYGSSQVARELQQSLLRKALLENPTEAAEIVRNASLPVPGHLLLEVVRHLRNEGRGEEADRLVQERIDDLLNGPQTSEFFIEFRDLLQTLSTGFPNLLLPTLQEFMARGGDLAPPGLPGARMVNHFGSTQLTASEIQIYWLLRNNLQRPETLLRTLDAFPELKGKLELIGGFDQSLEANISHTLEDNSQVFPSGPTTPPAPSFSYRWGEAASHPEDVRRRLDAAFPGGLNWNLVELVRYRCVDDPAFSRITLELMSKRTSQIPEIGTRQNWLGHLVGAYRFCEGKIPDSLIQEGFRILAEVRRQSQPMVAGNMGCTSWDTPDLETELIKELSRRDMEAASKMVKEMSEPNRRLGGYIAMIEGRIRKMNVLK